MGGSNKKINKSISQERARTNQQYGQIFNPNIAQLNPAIERSNEERAYITNQYRDFINRQMGTGSQAGSKTSGGGGGGGGSSSWAKFKLGPQNYNEVEGLFRNFATTGGVDEAALEEALPGYREFAATGGYSPTDIANIRLRSTAPLSGAYAANKAAIERAAGLQGGYTPGTGAAIAKASRGFGQSLGETALSSEIALAEAIRQNKLAGLGGVASTNQIAQELMQKGKLAGTEGLTGIQKQRVAEEIQRRQMAQAAAQAAAARSFAEQQARYRNELSALGALGGLYSQAPGEPFAYTGALTGLAGQQAGVNQGLIGQQIQTAQLPSGWDRVMQGIGLVGGVAGAVGGIPGVGKAIGGLVPKPRTGGGSTYSPYGGSVA